MDTRTGRRPCPVYLCDRMIRGDGRRILCLGARTSGAGHRRAAFLDPGRSGIGRRADPVSPPIDRNASSGARTMSGLSVMDARDPSRIGAFGSRHLAIRKSCLSATIGRLEARFFAEDDMSTAGSIGQRSGNGPGSLMVASPDARREFGRAVIRTRLAQSWGLRDRAVAWKRSINCMDGFGWPWPSGVEPGGEGQGTRAAGAGVVANPTSCRASSRSEVWSCSGLNPASRARALYFAAPSAFPAF